MPPIPIRVTGIKKAAGEFAHPYLAVTHFGWDDGDGQKGFITRDRLYEFLTDGGKAYFRTGSGERAFRIAEMDQYMKVVKTELVEGENIFADEWNSFLEYHIQ
jgi:hypothetical protein